MNATGGTLVALFKGKTAPKGTGMLRTSAETTPTAVLVDPGGRRRRLFRAAVIAVGFGWAAVIALVVVGLAITPGAPRPAFAGTTAHRPAVGAAHRIGAAHRSSKVAPAPHNVPPAQAQTSTEFSHNPGACPSSGKCAGLGCKRSSAAAPTTPFGSVQAAFDGHGVAPPDRVSSGNFDCGGFSYQSQQLAANGFKPGDGVAVAGQVLTLPQVAPGAADEIIAQGQVINLNPARRPASELGFLGAGEFGTQTGPVTITYVGGSTQTATLRFADWYADVAAPGTVIAASGLWNVPPAQARSFGPAPVSVYYQQIPVDASKPIASVTLPRNPNLHLFDIGLPGAARFRTVISAYNDNGLATAAGAGNGNFDGAGHSYNSAALAAKGLRPGASLTARGVRFSWPRYGASRFDNIRTQGQTVSVTGAGRVLGFLGAATLGTQAGTITIHYSDGSSQSAVLSFADWRANNAAGGGTVVATVPWNLIRGAGQHQVSVYSATVPLQPGKTVTSVTLPVNIDMHVFAIAEGK